MGHIRIDLNLRLGGSNGDIILLIYVRNVFFSCVFLQFSSARANLDSAASGKILQAETEQPQHGEITCYSYCHHASKPQRAV